MQHGRIPICDFCMLRFSYRFGIWSQGQTWLLPSSALMLTINNSNIRSGVLGATWWRHQMEAFSALLAFCVGNLPVAGEFPAQRPVTRSFDLFFDLRLNKRLSKQSRGWWFETPSRPLWRHFNGIWKKYACDYWNEPYMTSFYAVLMWTPGLWDHLKYNSLAGNDTYTWILQHLWWKYMASPSIMHRFIEVLLSLSCV